MHTMYTQWFGPFIQFSFNARLVDQQKILAFPWTQEMQK